MVGWQNPTLQYHLAPLEPLEPQSIVSWEAYLSGVLTDYQDMSRKYFYIQADQSDLLVLVQPGRQVFFRCQWKLASWLAAMRHRVELNSRPKSVGSKAKHVVQPRKAVVLGLYSFNVKRSSSPGKNSGCYSAHATVFGIGEL